MIHISFLNIVFGFLFIYLFQETKSGILIGCTHETEMNALHMSLCKYCIFRKLFFWIELMTFTFQQISNLHLKMKILEIKLKHKNYFLQMSVF